MPGGKGFVDSPTWFQERFGFKEASFKETQGRFDFADGVLTSKANGESFYVGPFETPSLQELRAQLSDDAALASLASKSGGLTFENITGAAKTLHLDPSNAGAVFQVASQFNCLEMVGPGTRPEDGVTQYYCDATQGPACALSCPAATVFRNYFVNNGLGQANKNQIDCLADVGTLLQNPKKHHWRMVNGYCMPDAAGGIACASAQLASDPELVERVLGAMRVGVHWDTEVKGGAHRVCQVFCSALPVAYAKSVRSSDWAPLACVVLEGSYSATLAIVSLLAAKRGERVTVFLTAVGGGAFGNRSAWIVNSMNKALASFAGAPLDVKLVHFGTIPRTTYKVLEKGRKPTRASRQTVAEEATSEPLPAPEDAVDSAPHEGDKGVNTASGFADLEHIAALFAKFDENCDGVMSKSELCKLLLQVLDSSFTEEKLCQLFTEADADGDGDVHYEEFLAWVCKEESSVAVEAFRKAEP